MVYYYIMKGMMLVEKSKKLYTVGEEVANAVTHGIGTLLSIAACVLLIVFAAQSGSAMKVVCASIYGACLIILFLMSTLYHAIVPEKAKRVFRIFDHTSIFVLIAGSYTPIALVTLGGALGWTIFGIVWGVSVLGIVLNSISIERFKRFSMILYVALGWCVIFVIKTVLEKLPLPAFLLLLAGGIAYTLGIVFYKMKNVKYMHSVWHLFVLAGAILQYFCVQLYVVS